VQFDMEWVEGRLGAGISMASLSATGMLYFFSVIVRRVALLIVDRLYA